MEEYKQCILIREDLNLSKGKAAAQAAHAALLGYLAANPRSRRIWINQGMKKIVLKAKNLDQLHQLYQRALELKLPAALVEDRGLTEVAPGTITALSIGPGSRSKIDKLTGNLPLYK